ncbi:MAG: DUF4249 domain-containing protein [Saprospiraceae bacterium]|nr:DUF4249 domain-containing protein [Saprospiraceae bacterium]
MRFLIIIIAFLVALSCEDMETVIEIEMPPIEKELVIECYLEAGKPYRLMLTETKNYFDNLDECPFVRNAIVVITHAGQRDTLTEAIFFNDNCDPNDIIPYGFWPYLNHDSTRFFNYGSNTLCPHDFDNSFTVEVWDTTGRFAMSTTQFIPESPIEQFFSDSNNSGEYYALLSTMDDINTTDFYRFVLHKTSLTKKRSNGVASIPVARNPKFDRTLDDGGVFAGKEVTTASNYRFKSGDTLIGTIYHIDKTYHDYLESVGDAQSANASPFGQPAVVKSNIIGGQGIFAFLSYDRDTIVVP